MLLVLAACVSALAPSGRVEAATTNVSIVDFAFSSATITVATGDTVHWTNNGAESHTVTSVDPGFDSGIMSVGQEFSHTFSAAGSYAYVCGIHPQMTGTVNVQDPATSTATTAASATATRTSTPSSTPTGTLTPVTATATPPPATPAAGQTPALVAPGGQPAGGGVAPIRAPATGAGPGHRDDAGAVVIALAAVGAVLLVAGVARRRVVR